MTFGGGAWSRKRETKKGIGTGGRGQSLPPLPWLRSQHEYWEQNHETTTCARHSSRRKEYLAHASDASWAQQGTGLCTVPTQAQQPTPATGLGPIRGRRNMAKRVANKKEQRNRPRANKSRPHPNDGPQSQRQHQVQTTHACKSSVAWLGLSPVRPETPEAAEEREEAAKKPIPLPDPDPTLKLHSCGAVQKNCYHQRQPNPDSGREFFFFFFLYIGLIP